jgi:hypothetical protein
MRTCKSGKESFGTEKHCTEWISVWNRTANKHSKNNLKRAYLCPECMLWHATSQDKPIVDNSNVLLLHVQNQISNQLILLERKAARVAKLKTEMNFLSTKIMELIQIDKQIIKKISEL